MMRKMAATDISDVKIRFTKTVKDLVKQSRVIFSVMKLLLSLLFPYCIQIVQLKQPHGRKSNSPDSFSPRCVGILPPFGSGSIRQVVYSTAA
jgi:hypothetical protein